MIPGHVQEEFLQQLHDGELSDVDAAEVREHLQVCDRCQQRLHRLERLSGLVNLAAEDMASDVDFDALYGRITDGVRRESRAENKIVSIADWRERIRQSGAHVWVPTALAAAAVIAIITQIATREEPTGPQVADGNNSHKTMLAEAPGSTAVPLTSVVGEHDEPPPNSEVSQVDFGDSSGTLYEVALADGVSTPVVWINDN